MTNAQVRGKPDCGRTVGQRPYWMGDGQWESTKCSCIRPPGHDDECWCEHTKPEDPATPERKGCRTSSEQTPEGPDVR